MRPKFVWKLFPADPTRAGRLASRCGIDPLIGQLLLNRGISQPVEARRFLSPALESLDDPLRLPDMAQAVLTLRHAIAVKHPIVIFGDSDVDGITASALLYELLTELGAQVSVRLSNRLDDGYGFPGRLVSSLARAGVKLIILVDCGTNQVEEVRALAQHQIDTIILDHHVPAAQVAMPCALVNPYRGAGAGRGLCSVGLAFKLAQAIWSHEADRLSQYLDLAALGTLADYAPLVGDNRILVTQGLKRLPHAQRPGLQQLCEAVNLTTPTPEQVLRRLVPRLNAPGRLGDPRSVWKLLVERSVQGAKRLTEQLEQAYAKTKSLHRQILAEAHEQANRIHFKDQYVMVVGRRGWHPGLMGPVAANLVDRYARPAIALALGERTGVGSGRSLSAFNLFEALRACEGVLLRYGGHPAACGLTLSLQHVEAFREQINQHARATWDRGDFVPRMLIDLEVTLDDLTERLLSALEQFAPFGAGNPKPLFLLRHLTVEPDALGGVSLVDERARIAIRGKRFDCSRTERYDVVTSVGCVRGEPALSIHDLCASAVREDPLTTSCTD